MYDIDRDGRLSKEDVQETLKNMVIQLDSIEIRILFSVELGR